MERDGREKEKSNWNTIEKRETEKKMALVLTAGMMLHQEIKGSLMVFQNIVAVMTTPVIQSRDVFLSEKKSVH
jgi:uncharacterized protein YhaN